MDGNDPVLRGQLDYYRARADEWDAWVTDYMAPVHAELLPLLSGENFRHRDVLELACGTGYWTELLSPHAAHVSALDASPEMLQVLASKRLPNVTAFQQDLFAWCPDRQWDVIFTAHWLSHVPPVLFTRFWDTLNRALRPGGLVVVLDVTHEEIAWLDEHVWQEIRDGHQVSLARRRLADGAVHTIVKQYWLPDPLFAAVRPLGWSGTALPIGRQHARGFVYYTFTRSAGGRHA